MNTARRQTEKEDKRNRVEGKLSVILGNNRKGEIIIRNGDNLKTSAKNFATSYGLKKEFVPTIISSLEQLVANNKKRRPMMTSDDLQSFMQNPMSNSQSSFEEQELAIPVNESEIRKIEGQLLFRLNFELGEGRSAKLGVREGDNFIELS